jgi:hypothetical protein
LAAAGNPASPRRRSDLENNTTRSRSAAATGAGPEGDTVESEAAESDARGVAESVIVDLAFARPCTVDAYFCYLPEILTVASGTPVGMRESGGSSS